MKKSSLIFSKDKSEKLKRRLPQCLFGAIRVISIASHGNLSDFRLGIGDNFPKPFKI